MRPVLRDFLIGFVIGAATLGVLAAVRPSEVFQGAALLWQVPLAGLAGGLLFVVRRSSTRGAQRVGHRLAGRDPDQAQAEGDRAWRSFRRRRPVMSVVAVVALLLVATGLFWLRVTT